MVKRLQNKTAESRSSLLLALLYSTAVWLMAGLIREQWWLQFGCFILSALLIMKMNNKNLLIRIFSRSVSVTFIFLFTAAIFLFQSWRGGIAQLCCIGALMLLYDCYQDNTSVGLTYGIFLLLGIASLFDVYTFLYLPVFWLMMRVIVYSLSWRTFFSSLLGLLTPYWMLTGWILYHGQGKFADYYNRFFSLDLFHVSFHYESVPLAAKALIAFTVCLLVIGCIHFIRNSYHDKIRVRQIYYSFILLAFFSLPLVILLPQHDGLPTRMLIIATSPLYGHFWALTNTKLTNVVFCILLVTVILLTGFSLWTSSSLF